MAVLQGARVNANKKPVDRDSTQEELDRAKNRNDSRLKSAFESIFAKYGHDFGDEGDEIDMTSGEIVVDHGHLSALPVDKGDLAIWGCNLGTEHKPRTPEQQQVKWSRAPYSQDEDRRLLDLRRKGLGWSEIERQFPGRVESGLSNRWYKLGGKLSTLCKKTATSQKRIHPKTYYSKGSNIVLKNMSPNTSRQEPARASIGGYRVGKKHIQLKTQPKLFILKAGDTSNDDLYEEEWHSISAQRYTPVKGTISTSFRRSESRKPYSSLFAMLGDISDDELG